MTPLQIGTKTLQQSIGTLTEDIKSKKDQLSKLKNENTLKLEKIQWIKEKLHKFQNQERELLDQKKAQRIQGSLETDDNQQDQTMDQQNGLDKILKAGQFDKKFLQLLNSYLDKINRSFTKYGAKKLGSDGFINPYPVINIKPQLDGLTNGETIVLRLDEKTRFSQIKEMSFIYWMFDKTQELATFKEEHIIDGLELTDESYSVLPLQEYAFNFYQSQGKQNLDQITLILKQKKTSSEQLNGYQQESMKLPASKIIAHRLDSFFATNSKKRLIDPYEQFFVNLPGLRQFIDEELIHNEEKQRLKDEANQKKVNVEDIVKKVESFQHLYEVDDSHCCILSCILIILFLTIMQYGTMLESSLVYKKVTAFNLLFDLVPEVPGSYYSIQTQEDFWLYVKTFVGRGLLDSESRGNFYRDNNEIIGSIRLRQLKMPSQKCQSFVNQYQATSCFLRQYDQDNQYTLNKSNESNQTDAWRFFQNAKQLKSVYSPSGIITDYSGDGYVVDFQRDITYEVFLQQIIELEENQYLDLQTSAVFVQFTSYSPTSNIWTYCVLIFERNIQNQFIPYYPTLLLFVPNLYEGKLGLQNFIIDIVRVILAIILSIFTFYSLKKKNKNEDNFLKWNFLYLFVEAGGLNLTVATLSIASFITTIIQTSLNLKNQDLVNLNSFVVQFIKQYEDLYSEAQYYNITFIIQGLNILFVCIRVSVVLKCNDNLNLIFLTLNKAVIQIGSFILLLVPYFIGFVLAFQQLWGTFYPEFSSFSSSLGNLFRLAQGFLNLTAFQDNASYSTPIFISIFYFFVVFFITSIFQAFLIESWRTVIMTRGYPQPQEQPVSIKTVTHWTFSWFYCWIDIPIVEKIEKTEKTEKSDLKKESLIDGVEHPLLDENFTQI